MESYTGFAVQPDGTVEVRTSISDGQRVGSDQDIVRPGESYDGVPHAELVAAGAGRIVVADGRAHIVPIDRR